MSERLWTNKEWWRRRASLTACLDFHVIQLEDECKKELFHIIEKWINILCRWDPAVSASCLTHHQSSKIEWWRGFALIKSSSGVCDPGRKLEVKNQPAVWHSADPKLGSFSSGWSIRWTYIPESYSFHRCLCMLDFQMFLFVLKLEMIRGQTHGWWISDWMKTKHQKRKDESW